MAEHQSKTPNRGSYGLGSEASFTGYSQFSGSQQPTNVSYNHYMQTAGGGTQQPMFVPIYIHSPNKGKEKTDRRHSRRDGHSKKRPRDEDDAKAPFRKEHQGEIILEEDLERDLKRRRAEAAANEVAIKQAVADQKAEIERLRDQVNKLSAQHRAEAAASAQKFKTLEDQCARYATQIEEMTKQSALVQSINTEMRSTRSTVDKLDARMAQMEKMPAPQPATAAPSMPKLDASKTPFGSSEPPATAKPPSTESTADTTKAPSTELPKPATGGFSFGAAPTEAPKVETKATEEDNAKPPASTATAGFSFGGTKAEDAPKASPFGGSAPASTSPAPKLDTAASFSFGSTPSFPGQTSSTATAAPAAPTPAPASTPFGGSSPFSSTAPAASAPAAPTSSSPFGAAPTTAAPASTASPFGAPSAPTPSSGGNPFATSAGAAPSFNTGGGASAPAPSGGGFGATPSAPAAPNLLGARKAPVRAKRY